MGPKRPRFEFCFLEILEIINRVSVSRAKILTEH